MSRSAWIAPVVAATLIFSHFNVPRESLAGCPTCECNSCCEQCGGKKRCCLRPAPAPRGGVVQTMNARISEQPAKRSSDDDRVKKLETELEDLTLQIKIIAASIKVLQATKESKTE